MKKKLFYKDGKEWIKVSNILYREKDGIIYFNYKLEELLHDKQIKVEFEGDSCKYIIYNAGIV